MHLSIHSAISSDQHFTALTVQLVDAELLLQHAVGFLQPVVGDSREEMVFNVEVEPSQ